MSIISPVKSKVQPNLDILTHYLLYHLYFSYFLSPLFLLPSTYYQSRIDNNHNPNAIL